MPVYRGPDGKIIEENTRSISSSQNKNKSESNIDGKTRRLSSRPVAPTFSDEAAVEKEISGETKIYRGTSSKLKNQTQDELDPVVGWLVVVAGQGKGADFSLKYGVNTIGRGENEIVSLNFGDKQISRESHAILTFEPKSAQFYIQGGGGRNLTYLDGEVVLTPTLLQHNSIIQVGETDLKFVSFCNDSFNWES